MSDFPIMKCIVKGCDNHKGEGQFVNDICSPCHRMLTEGVVTPSYNWFATEITIAIERTKKAEVELAACSAAFDKQQEQLDRNADKIAALRNALSQLVAVYDAMGGICGSARIAAEEALLKGEREMTKHSDKYSDIISDGGLDTRNAAGLLATHENATLREQLAAAQQGWERECQDGDEVAAALGVERTEGGSLNVPKILAAIAADLQSKNQSIGLYEEGYNDGMAVKKQWVDLTDKDREECLAKHEKFGWWSVIDAIEEKLCEKNGG